MILTPFHHFNPFHHFVNHFLMGKIHILPMVSWRKIDASLPTSTTRGQLPQSLGQLAAAALQGSSAGGDGMTLDILDVGCLLDVCWMFVGCLLD